MNVRTKTILLCVSSFSLGGLISWAVTADAADRKREGLEQEFQDSIHIIAKKHREISALRQQLNDLEAETTVEEKEELDSGGEIEEVSKESPEETRERLQSLINTYTGRDQDPVSDVIEAAVEMEGHDEVAPYVITQQQYAWDEEADEYEKATITYYSTHRVLLDEDEDVIVTSLVDQTVGWKNLRRFGDESGSPDVVFVRNRRLQTDFEIVEMPDDDLPHHVQLGMSKTEYEINRSAGLIKFPEETV